MKPEHQCASCDRRKTIGQNNLKAIKKIGRVIFGILSVVIGVCSMLAGVFLWVYSYNAGTWIIIKPFAIAAFGLGIIHIMGRGE